MISNYFKTAYRNLMRNRGFSLINIFGLAGGLAVCMLILTIVIDQNNYDKFHENRDRIYRIVSYDINSDVLYAAAPYLLENELLEGTPSVEVATSFRAHQSLDLKFREKIIPFKGYYANSSFFDVFDFPLTAGESATGLDEPYDIMLSESACTKLGINTNDIGSFIEVNDWGNFRLTGIIKDLPYKSHMKFDFLASHSTINALSLSKKADLRDDSWNDTWDTFVYTLLKKNASTKALEESLNVIASQQYKEAERPLNFQLQSLSKINPTRINNNELSEALPYFAIRFLVILAIIVLLTACFNYTNLTIAQSLTRIKEIGVRKVMGANRLHILLQFITEAILVALLSLGIAIVLLEFLILPQFRQLYIFPNLDFNLKINYQIYFLFCGLSLLTGLGAGLIPSLYLSSFRPVNVLKKIASIKVLSKIGLRKTIISFQFFIALVFFVTIMVMYQQGRYMFNAEYGFDKENILNISLQGNDFQKAKSHFEGHPSVSDISGSLLLPGTGMGHSISYYDEDTDEDQHMYYTAVDENFIDNVNFKIIAGRQFNDNDITGQSQVIINEKALEKFGFENKEAAINQVITLGEKEGERTPAKIIGVMKDFVTINLMRNKSPMMFTHEPDKIRFLNLKIHAHADIQNTLAFVETQWNKLDPVHPVEYQFYEEKLNENVAVFKDGVALLGFITFVTLLITVMGLLGISSYLAQTRRKEVGIRKVLGGSLGSIVWTLSRGTIIPITIAVLIGLPVVYFLNNAWLETIAYRIHLNFLNIGLGILFMFLLGIGIVASQAFLTAQRNPIDALRSE